MTPKVIFESLQGTILNLLKGETITSLTLKDLYDEVSYLKNKYGDYAVIHFKSKLMEQNATEVSYYEGSNNATTKKDSK